ncbi:glycosyltransferase family 2 protein [Microbacterium bovistercoris]|uniref:Glycosyltransferase family 2 protein n=1 Tax=Microbacterium bovistercoris TaxID=2293570 RepID=A0A371NYU5_9MICO|nr:glycosyltransferase family 2 protein [Microbacterium bovistercoris]
MSERSGTERPVASLVIPSRGGVDRLPHLFHALGRQTTTDWEAIVVLDGDIDSSAGVVDAAAAELPVRSIVFDENRGRSAALNAGFAAARGQVLIRCDDDLRPAPDYVASHIARHESSTAVGVIGLYRNVYPDTAYARAYGRARDRRFREEAYAATATWRYWAGNVSVTRETYDRVGDYDEDYRAYGWEDVDWGYRLQVFGAEVILAPELETLHHIAAVTTEIRIERAFHSGAARRTFVGKHGSQVFGERAPDHGWWGRLIDRTAERDGLSQLRARARKADATLDRMPRWAAEKRVSWLVESAARSGEMHPEQVSADV